MKVLGWMQSRLRQSTLSLKDCSFGYSCTCLCLQPPAAADSTANPSHGQWKSKRLEPLAVTEAKNGEEEMSGLFHGFLAIGTLDIKKVISEPSTPTFGVSEEKSVENGREDEEEEEVQNTVVGTKLKVVKEEGGDIQGIDCREVGSEERRTSVNESNRVSLGELLEKNIMEDMKTCMGYAAEGKDGDPEEVESVKKPANRRPDKPSKPSAAAADPVPATTRFQKMKRMVKKKVSSMVKAQGESRKNQRRASSVSVNCGGGMRSQILPEEDLRIIVQRSKIKDVISWHKGCPTLPHLAHPIDASKGGGEYWIKTDADYLVLEL